MISICAGQALTAAKAKLDEKLDKRINTMTHKAASGLARSKMKSIVDRVARMYNEKISLFTEVNDSDVDGQWTVLDVREHEEVTSSTLLLSWRTYQAVPLQLCSSGIRAEVLHCCRNSVHC